MTELERRRMQAEQRMVVAKAFYTRAARAALAGLPLAQAMTQAALEDTNQARRELEQLRATEPGPGGEGV